MASPTSLAAPTTSTTARVVPVPPAPRPTIARHAMGTVAGGTASASWYAYGSRTADGEAFNPDAYTFASRTMPFGTLVRFTHDGRSVIARCTDRGPFVAGRDFDLSRAAFAALAPLSSGVTTVTWAIVP